MTQAVSGFSSIRVALVTGGLKLGGSTTFLCNFAGELVRRTIPVQVLSFERTNPMASDFEHAKIPVFCEDETQSIFEDRLARILNRLAALQPTAVLATLSAQSFEVLRYMPTEVTRVGVGQSDDPLVYETMKHYGRHMNFLAVVSEIMREKASTITEFREIPVRYLPYGVPMPGPVERAFAGPLRILYLGRLEREQKRVQLFPQILVGLKQSGIPFHWTIAGDGPELGWLRQEMVGNPSSQTVSLTGKVAYADVPELLRRHDIFLLASDYEGLPLSLLEAMGAGLVPVVSNLPSGIRELVDQQTGRSVAVDNVAGYSQAIIDLHQDREMLKKISARAVERVRTEFSVEAMTDRWLKSFPSAAQQRIEWPRSWKIKRPLVSSDWLRFSPPARIARRAALKLSRRFTSARHR